MSCAALTRQRSASPPCTVSPIKPPRARSIGSTRTRSPIAQPVDVRVRARRSSPAMSRPMIIGIAIVDARHPPTREHVVIVERRGADAHDDLARSRARDRGNAPRTTRRSGPPCSWMTAALIAIRLPWPALRRRGPPRAPIKSRRSTLPVPRERQLGDQLHVARMRIGRARGRARNPSPSAPSDGRPGAGTTNATGFCPRT